VAGVTHSLASVQGTSLTRDELKRAVAELELQFGFGRSGADVEEYERRRACPGAEVDDPSGF